MKIVLSIFTAAAFLAGAPVMQAQVNLQNTGTLYITGSPDILYVNGSFTNASTAALTNNGNLYVLQNLVNDQSSVAIGTGSLYFSGSAAQTLSGAQPFRTFNLVTNNAAGITLNSDLSVSGVHTFTAGVVGTSATPNYLMYEAGSSYTGDGDTKHVTGWVRKTGTTAFTFPVGNGTVERTIGISSLSGSSVFNANYAGATTNRNNIVSPLVTVDGYEYWNLDKISGGTAVANMNWNTSKIAFPQYTLADVRVADYITGLWTQVGNGATGNVTTTGNIASSARSSFGPLTFGSISLALPLTLINFSAVKDNGYAVVSWTTTDEVNVSHFEIQRSDDGIGFYTVGNVDARNQAVLQQYSFTDSKALNDVTYYRLRSVDLDGKVKLSDVAALSNSDAAARSMAIANPAHNNIHLTSKNISGVFEYRINTLSGQTIQQGNIKIAAAAGVDIPLSSAVKQGLYILQVQKKDFNFTQKVLVQ